MKAETIITVIILALLLFGAVILFNYSTTGKLSLPKNSQQGMYKEFKNPSGYVNTDNITMSELIGKKVILIDFMTYTCINCQRTFPYLNEWYEKYKDQGLEIIGVHTPEFAFEKNIKNVRKAMERFNIKFPIILDNDYKTWQSYGNRYWPHKYLIDITGEIVYDHIGEGAYEETEKVIQRLLNERAELLGQEKLNNIDLTEDKKSSGVGSPEIYFGANRNEYLGNGKIGRVGTQDLSIPSKISKNILYLGGQWNIQPEYSQGNNGTVIKFKYIAKNVYLVLGGNAKIVIKRDGELVGQVGGRDVIDNEIVINQEKLYHLIGDENLGEHIIEIEIEGNLEVYAFTFG